MLEEDTEKFLLCDSKKVTSTYLSDEKRLEMMFLEILYKPSVICSSHASTDHMSAGLNFGHLIWNECHQVWSIKKKMAKIVLKLKTMSSKNKTCRKKTRRHGRDLTATFRHLKNSGGEELIHFIWTGALQRELITEIPE